ncbi:hypothetical protein [Borreliella burgdorferi]|uniref:hypothetical protein n=1 Tax=Borreliella burgdorferi TaxID=139 RepID=UPI001E46DBF6|nr:hypothetical protein [Borreliella burgdorferi]MCD2380241.1 hypothetical protein [Borreliella burgdorferi]
MNKKSFHSANKNYAYSLIRSKFNKALAKTNQHEVDSKTLLEYLEILEKIQKQSSNVPQIKKMKALEAFIHSFTL